MEFFSDPLPAEEEDRKKTRIREKKQDPFGCQCTAKDVANVA